MQELYDHINKFSKISFTEFEEVLSFFEMKSVIKKEVFYRPPNQILKHYFVVKGCVHLYFINERGTEQTLQFGINNWWITDYSAFQHNRNSEFYIQAVEDSVILQITYQKQEELLQRVPKVEAYFRNIYQIGYGAAIMRMKYIFSYSKEEIYFKFRDAYPEFVNSVPQYLVATYLGLSPEYVSKLRRKSIS